MRRPQFTLKSLLWLMAVVAAFCGGTYYGRHLDIRDQESFKQAILMLGDDNARLHNLLHEHGWHDPELELTTLDDVWPGSDGKSK